MEAAREEFLDELCAIPGIAVLLVERWNERRRRGHVTAALSAHYRDRSGRDPGPEIDRALARIERRVQRRDGLREQPGRDAVRELAAIEEQLARAVRRADIAFELMEELCGELGTIAASARSATRREARRRLGLDEPRHRTHLRRARAALGRHDRVKQTFVVHNLRLVVKQAKRLRNMGVPYADLIQEGNLGLIRAVEKFDYRLGYRFSTYAVWWIEQALVRAVQNHSRTVRVPTHVYDLHVRLRRIREQLRTRLGRPPALQELAEAAGASIAEVQRATDSMQPIASTQTALAGSEDRVLEDVLADEEVDDPSEAIAERQIRVSLGRKLTELEPRERWILEAHYGLGETPPRTLREIGEELGISRERVRQIEAQALERLRGDEEMGRLGASLDLGGG